MVINNIKEDLKAKLEARDATQANLAEVSNTTTQYISRLVRKNTIVNPMYVKLMEVLGFDIKIEYKVRRQK